MKTIKFSHHYPKLWGQKEAILLDVKIIGKDTILHKDFIEYDTKDCEGNYYKLPKTNLIQLIFLGNKNIPFCTVRRFNAEKWQYYYKLVLENFKIEIEEKKDV